MAWQLTLDDVPAATPPAPRALTVTEALKAADDTLREHTLVVEGEVSEHSDPRAYKALYFSVAGDDGQSVMPCIMWKDRYKASGVELRPGLRVRMTGRFSVYAKKGRMQFQVDRISLAGEGELRRQVDALARRLELEGLMSDARKRPVPAFCQRVAVVTSPHGKAIHDVIRTLRRRNPLVELLVFGVVVEGQDAPRQMRDALNLAARQSPDAILLVRGGGSYEDLMPFNDEGLARSVAACPVPVVTGIGHEPDRSICDMVGDRSCSTPTAAAESVAPTAGELEESLEQDAARLATSMSGHLGRHRERLESLATRPVLRDPRAALVTRRAEQLDLASDRLVRAIPAMVARRSHSRAALRDRLRAVGASLLRGYAGRFSSQASELRSFGPRMLEPARRDLAAAAGKLDALSPLAVIARGYAIATDSAGGVVSKVGAVSAGDRLDVRVQDGRILCTVASTQAAAAPSSPDPASSAAPGDLAAQG